ncbi:MAG: hypothetical protein RIA69_12035 [Cyclobacteriaceae bacterium]
MKDIIYLDHNATTALEPEAVSKSQTSFMYASEADLLNTRLFGITA